MVQLAWALLCVLVSYLLGAIPFGFLVAKWVKGVDIRTVGSGNIGATNVGRVLGFRFFVLVFVLDVLKGLLPTLGLPLAVARVTGTRVPALPVFVALAAILGHNFPIYLRLRGGKGVATSFGALLALDPVAMISAAVSFLVFLLITQIVSISSILGGVVFVGVHFFLLVESPFGRDQWALSVASIGLLVLLVVRHRANLARIAAGTEPKVMLFKKRKSSPSGRIGVVLLALVALGGSGAALAAWAARPCALECGSYRLVATARLATGHQRAERLACAESGRLLAVTCPRYNRLVLARASAAGLVRTGEILLEGRPMAVQATAKRWYALERPIADAHHVEAGWLEAFDFAGKRAGSRLRVGFDPDDLALSRDGRWAYVLTSGNAEGETNRPGPALFVVELASQEGGEPVIRSRLQFTERGDDPERIALALEGDRAAVSLYGSNQVAWIDLHTPEEPRLLGRTPVANPGPLVFTPEGSLIVASTEQRGMWRIESANAQPVPLPISGPCADVAVLRCLDDTIACTLPRGSGLELVNWRTGQSLGKLALRGPANLGATRPLGLAVDPQGTYLAVANRQGGSVHLVAVARGNRAAQGTLARARSPAGRR